MSIICIIRNSALYLLTFVSRSTAGGGWGECSCLLGDSPRSSVLRLPGLSAVSAGAVAAQKTLTRWSVSMSSISSSGHEEDRDSAMVRRSTSAFSYNCKGSI